MNPLDAFKRALFYVSGLCSSRTMNKPGAVIERLSASERQALTQLKSDEIGPTTRIDDLKYYVGSDEYYQQQEFQKERLEFDKKLKK
jgi:hypothetical protein